jgi:hypothetical protein
MHILLIKFKYIMDLHWPPILERDHPSKSSVTSLSRMGRGLRGCLSLNNQWATKIWITFGFSGWLEYGTLLQENQESQILRE